MEIATYNRNQPFALTLDSSSSDRIISVFETRPEIEDVPYLKSAEHLILNGFVKTFRAKAVIKSIPEVELPNLSVEQSRTERLNLTRNLQWSSARKELKLYVAQSYNDWFHIGSVALLNIPPFQVFNLMEMYTENLALELGSTGAIGVSVHNAGYGLLGANDEVTIFGSATTEVVVIPAKVPPLQNCTPYGWTLTTESQLILPAMTGRKQITLTNTGPGEIYLNIGNDAQIGTGIALMPNGGSYEFNRANHPVNLSIHAIATEPSELSGLVCV